MKPEIYLILATLALAVAVVVIAGLLYEAEDENNTRPSTHNSADETFDVSVETKPEDCRDTESMTDNTDDSDNAEPAVFEISQEVYGRKPETMEYTEHDAEIKYPDGSVDKFTFDKMDRGSKGITFYNYMETRKGKVRKRAFKFIPYSAFRSFDTTKRRTESVVVDTKNNPLGWFSPSEVETLREGGYGDYDEIVVNKERRFPI